MSDKKEYSNSTWDEKRRTWDVKNEPNRGLLFTSHVLRFSSHVLLLLFFLLTVTGCASLGTYNPATGRTEFIAIPTSDEVTMGRQLHERLQKQYKFSYDQEQIERIEQIGIRLARISDRQDLKYHFYVIDKDDLNAFTTPGGNIYLFTGLIDKLETDDRIASVIAHEIGHTAAKHTIKKFQAALGYDLVKTIILSASNAGGSAASVASLSSGTVMSIIFSAYGRKDEYEADRLGVKYMYLADYDLKGVSESLAVLLKESKEVKTPLILRSHPHLQDRIAAVKEEVALAPYRYGME